MTASLQSIPLARIDGTPASLADYAGSVLLIVNVASKCGLTPQYEGLESLYRSYQARVFAVLGFPSNDFAGQEPGSDSEIAAFCTMTFGVQFPMFSKIVVTGEQKHPLYRALTTEHASTEWAPGSAILAYQQKHFPESAASSDVHWNFEKFLIGRDGTVLRRFGPDTLPTSETVVQAIEAALG